MIIECLGEKCQARRLMRIVLLAAGAYHILFAVWANLWPYHGFDLFGLPRPNHPMLWRTLGLISGMLGFALLIAAKDPVRHWLVILFALIKSIVASIIVGSAIYRSELPIEVLAVLFIDDLVWIPPAIYILWGALRAHAGIPPTRSLPYTPQEAAEVYRLSTGATLLRHFGCTFTRQILRGLQDLEQQAKNNDATLVLVHMLQSGQEIDYLGHNSDIPRIADPRCELYRAFGLGKGGFLELFGPHVWWRGAISVFKGCGVGHLAGDGLQMPGVFVFKNGEILCSQPAHSAADLPDLAALFNHTPMI
jgi:hypothetical protein